MMYSIFVDWGYVILYYDTLVFIHILLPDKMVSWEAHKILVLSLTCIRCPFFQVYVQYEGARF
jgi:hypothetical protein